MDSTVFLASINAFYISAGLLAIAFAILLVGDELSRRDRRNAKKKEN